MIVEAELMPNYLAASHYPSALFQAAEVVPVGSRAARGTRRRPKQGDIEDQPAKVFLLSASIASLDRLEALFTSPTLPDESVAEDMVKFTDLRLENADRVLQMGTGEVPTARDGLLAFEAVLHPQLAAAGEPDPAAEQRVREDFIAYIAGLGGRVNEHFVGQEGGMWHLPVLLAPGALRSAASFAQLRTLRPMPQLRPTPGAGDVLYELRSVPFPSATAGRRIAVFDGGVGFGAPGLDQWVTEYNHTDQPHLTAHREHGTAVTSAALFGPLDLAGQVSVPHAGVDHHRIWPLPAGVDVDGELAWVLSQIENAVEAGDYRVAVITLAPALTVEDSEPHRWTSALDRIGLDHNVLFIVAAGNTGDLAPGLDRILVPADLINGLSVGSCTDRTGLAVRDSYSCVGPGRPGGMTAPTGVQFGGNLDAEVFAALTASGAVAGHEGTSLAAPYVARGCAQLDTLIEGGASANLLRTMAVHHAERPNKKQAETTGSTTRDVGYGRFPTSYLERLEHRPNELTVIYEGAVKRRQRIALDIPIPDDVFASAPTKTFNIKWTLGFFAPVEPSNPVDYSAAGIQGVFRPHAFKFPATKDGKPVGLVDTRDTNHIKFVTEKWGWKIGNFAETASKKGFAPEVVQRQHHGKWEGVVRVDTGLQGKSLCRPRLDFHALVREGGDLLKEADDLRYVLVVGVTAPVGVNLYDRTLAHATLLSPLPVTIPVIVGGS